MSWLDSLKTWIGGKRDKAAQSLTADPAGAYRASTYNRQSLANLIVHDLPPFTLATARIMLESDPLVRFALNVRNAAMSGADVEVKAANPRVKQWVETQWKTLWNKHRGALTAVHRWGFAAIQPLWKECKDGTYDIADVKEFAPEDVRPLAHKGRPVGVRVRRPDVRLLSPRSCWITFDAEAGAFYGNGCLRRMYQPWYYKWMQGGQQKLLQQRMLKDAYIGDIFWYPADLMVKLPDGTQIPWKDITREIAECRVSGSALNLPMLKDREGNKLVEYTPPQDIGGSSQIFEWGDKINEDILLGADVAIEVVKASDTGSGFSGRSIPLMVTIAACDQELVDIVKAIEIQILRPAAWLIFGGDPEFELTPKPLMESFAKDAGGSPMGGSAIGGQPGQQLKEQGPQPKMGWVGQNGDVTQFKEDAAGEWITIGGKQKGDEKHSGGFPVQIDADGRILKSGGPKGLVGKHVSRVGEHFASERHKASREQEIKDWGSGRKGWGTIVARQAKKWKIDEETYVDIADSVWGEKTQIHAEREAAKKFARDRLKLTAADVNRLENKGFDHGSTHSRIKGLDVVGREMAGMFPTLGWGGGYDGEDRDDLDEQVWELIREGKQELPARTSQEFHEEIDSHIQYQMEQARKRRKQPQPVATYDDDEQFDETFERIHPRNDDGSFATKDQLVQRGRSVLKEIPGVNVKGMMRQLGVDEKTAGEILDEVKKPEGKPEFSLSTKPKQTPAKFEGMGKAKQVDLFAGRGDSPGQTSFFDDIDPAAKNVGAMENPGNKEPKAKDEPAKAEWPEFMKDAGIKDEKTARKKGLTSVQEKAPAIAKQVISKAKNWVWGSTDSAQKYLATEIVKKTAMMGGLPAALRSLANDYERRATGASEPNQPERFRATAQGLVEAAIAISNPERDDDEPKAAEKEDALPGIREGTRTDIAARELIASGQMSYRQDRGVWEAGPYSGKTAGEAVRAWVAANSKWKPAKEQYEEFKADIERLESQNPGYKISEKLSQKLERMKSLAEETQQFDEQKPAQTAPQIAAKSRIEEIRQRTANLAKRIRDPQNLFDHIVSELRQMLPLLGADLSAAMYGAHLGGYAGVIGEASALSGVAPPVTPPPPADLVGLLFPEGPPPGVRLPALADAIDTIRKSPLAAGADFRQTAELVRQGAFAVTGDLTEQAVDDLRQTLARTLEKGGTVDDFTAEVRSRFEDGGPLSKNHLETVFRTQTAAAQSNGQDAAIKQPMVADAFPYRAYYATTDRRVREQHIALEKGGLDGTNIYRADDPTWKKFRPPWDFNCRCAWSPVSVEQAARRGVTEARDWWNRAQAMAKELGGDAYEMLPRTVPFQVEHVPPPPFAPPAEFERR